MLLEIPCDGYCVRAVFVHSDWQCFESVVDKPCVEWARAAADVFYHLEHLVFDRLVSGCRESADYGAVSAYVFCCRMNDDVGAEFQRALQVRSGEGVVDDHSHIGVYLVGEVGDGLDVDDVECRVDWCFEEDESGVGVLLDCRFDGVEVGHACFDGADAEPFQDGRAEVFGSAVEDVADDDSVSG